MTITIEEIQTKHNEVAAMIAEFKQQPLSFEYQGKQIKLNPGEIYAGTIITPGEYGSYHLILLPGEADSVNWKGATEWATQQGGELPNRVEGALLFATLKSEFKEEAHWTRETHASDAGYALVQFFDIGNQKYYDENCKFRARAVRRLIIE